jgi:hypothetical protein
LDLLADTWLPVSKLTGALAKHGAFNWLTSAGVRKAITAAIYRLAEHGIVEHQIVVNNCSHAELQVRRR